MSHCFAILLAVSLFFSWLSVYSPLGHASVKSLDFSIHQEYVSTRAMAMGGAFAAVVDDHSALFYNPAALAWRSDGNLRMFLRGGEDDILALTEDIEKIDSETDTEAEEFDAYQELLDKNIGNHFYGKVNLGAIWVRPNWGVAVIPADVSVDVSVHRQAATTLNINAYNDTTIAYGYARKVKWLPKGHEISVGGTLKAIHRIHAGQALAALDLVVDSEVFDLSDANEGMTVDVDLGILYEPRIPTSGLFSYLEYFKPSFALVARNLIDHGFQWNFHLVDEESGEPPNLQRRFDVGAKIDLPDLWVFDPHLAYDLRDIGHENWSFTKGSHAGAELYWKLFNWWKGYWSVGMNQGYWTAGVGARFAFFQLDIASYGEEVGTDDAPVESRRWLVEASLDF